MRGRRRRQLALSATAHPLLHFSHENISPFLIYRHYPLHSILFQELGVQNHRGYDLGFLYLTRVIANAMSASDSFEEDFSRLNSYSQ